MMRDDIRLDFVAIPKELSFMLMLMNMEQDQRIAINEFTDIDWNRFLELTRHHRVYPIVYKKLRELSLHERWIPEIVMQILSKEYQKNIYQMLHLSGEMETICRLLTDHHIHTLFLKGPVLAADLYGDLSLRTSCDLDILVLAGDLNRSEQLLGTLGYKKDEYIQTILGDWKWRHHHITFFHPEKGVKVEIHWRLSPGPSSEPIFNELWARKRKSTLTLYPIYYLGREDLFFFLVCHGARHGWSRLRWLADIHQIALQPLDWAALNKLLAKHRSLDVAGQALILASRLLHTPVTEPIHALIGRNRANRLAHAAMYYIRRVINLHSLPVPEDVSRYHKRHLFALMSMESKVLFVLGFLYPYPEDAKTLPLPKKLHFLYFPLRPILWAWRKSRRHVLPY